MDKDCVFLFSLFCQLNLKHAEKINEFANATEIAEEKAKAFANSANSSIENIASNRSILSELNKEYKELRDGVNELGINTKLSADKYERYKEIISQVSNIMPNLTAHFNAQGEAIAFTKGKLSDLTQEYEKYIQKEAKEFLVKGDSDGNTFQGVLDNFVNNSNMGFWENQINRIKNAFGFYDINDLPVDTMLSTFKEMQNRSKNELIKYLKDTDKGLFGETIDNANNRAKKIAQKELGESVESIKEMNEDAFNQLQIDIASHIESLQNNYSVDMSAIVSGLMKSAQSKDSFWALAEDQQNNVTTLLSSITSDAWKSIWKGDTNVKQSEVEAFVERIINAINSNKDGFSNAWKELFNIDEDIPVLESKKFYKKITLSHKFMVS